MSTREFFIKCFRNERPTFVKVLRALPPGQLGYRPHPRSTSAGDIVWLLASELHDACDLLDKGEASFSQSLAPAALEESIAAYERNASGLEERLEKANDARWEKSAKFLVGGKVAWEAPLGEMLWGFLFDAIHHRGQLSSYLRPMGGKVPSIYGPSGDDPGQ
jgi:uncharacterized damage-inducible protein DinB